MWDADATIIVPIVALVNGLIAKSFDQHLRRVLDQKPDAQGSFSWDGAYNAEVPLSGALATDGELLSHRQKSDCFLFLNVSFITIYI